MSLASQAFLLLFLPSTLVVYYRFLETPRSKMLFLLAASVLFYASAGWQFVPLMLGISALTFLAGRQGALLPGILLNLAALALFKYWGFGLQTFNALLSAAGLGTVGRVLQLGLPLGISFFVFKHVGYLLDLRARRYPAGEDIWTFLTFSAYFPQIGAGPISSYRDTAGQFASLPARLEEGRVASALVYLSYGLAKKVLLADPIGLFITSEGSAPGSFAGFFPAWYRVIAYSAQLYFDFSGYSDMALGVSALFGVKLPPNFNSPYLARDAGEFWERWHISLSTWFRHYLFSPLSRSLLRGWGSARRESAQYAANLATMALVGLWHGAGWGYVAWGLYHGTLLNLNAWWKRSGRGLPPWLGRPLFLVGILMGWALFMSPSWHFLRDLVGGMAGYQGPGSLAVIRRLWEDNATLALLPAIPLAFSGRAEASALLDAGRAPARWQFVGWGVLAGVALLLIQREISFFYVQF